MRENSATRKVSFLDQQHEHSASVALATRISKDPKGSPTSENITENYQKTVSTNFKMRKPKIEKRHREEEEEEGGEKEDPSLHYINQEETPPVYPYVEEMWGRIMMLESLIPEKKPVQMCFDFRDKGECTRGDRCYFLHDTLMKGRPPEKNEERPSRRNRSRTPPRRGKYRSPQRQSESSRRRDRSPRKRSLSPYLQHRNPYPVQLDCPDACQSMVNISRCSDYECRLYHGFSNLDPSVTLCRSTNVGWCPYLYSTEGCKFHHNRQYE